MKTLDEVLELLTPIDRPALEHFIARQWLRPVAHASGWYFEEIDIARVQLVWHLTQDIQINDDGMDVVLQLLDQLYGLRAHMKRVTHAIGQQPEEIQERILQMLSAET
jgi:chaperone modulatory protein CbpM